MKLKVNDNNTVPLSVGDNNGIGMRAGDTIDRGVKDYNYLDNKPQIEGVELVGNKTLDDLDAYTQSEVDSLLSSKADSDDIPTKTSQLQNDSGYITDAGVTSFNGNTGAVTYTAPVTKVNNKTGAVSLTATDVGALPDTTSIPSKTSQLQNDSGFITDAGVTSFNGNTGAITYTAPVTKVNNKTGDVSLTASDVGAVPTTRTVNSKALSADITLFASDVGALPDTTSIPSKVSDLDNDSNFTTKTYVDGTSGRVYYGQVDSTSTATVFTAQIDGITEYYDGLAIMLKNGVITSASGFTININGLGAKGSYNNTASGYGTTLPTRDTTLFNIAYTMLFIYDADIVEGGGWICYRGYGSNTNTIGYQVRTNSYSLPMDSVTYRYRLLFTSDDNEHFVPANNSTSTNATASRTVCQSKINPFGPIVYYGTTAAVAAGSRPSVSYLWQQYVLTLGYSFNRTGSALTLTLWKPVYVKCAPQADGSAIIDDTTPYVQELPSTADGKIYIYLGVAYSETQIELNLSHPVYWHDGTGIQIYNGAMPLIGSTLDITPAQVSAAVKRGANVAISYTDPIFGVLTFSTFNTADSMDTVISSSIVYYNGAYIVGELIGYITTNNWSFQTATLVTQ